MKEDSVGVESGDMGSTVPAMWRVILGCVSVNGSVLTSATGTCISVSLPVVGRDTINGRDGDVKLKDSGAGSMIVARA